MRKNIVIGFVFLIIVFVVIAGRFTYIQVFKAEELQRDVVEQRVKKIKEMPERGSIVDVNGKTLAMSLNVKDIAVYPNLITREETAEKLAEFLSEELGLNYEYVHKSIMQTNDDGKRLQWVRIAKRVDPEVANDLKESKYASLIEISGSPRRYYPNGSVASNILGFVNHENLPGGGMELSLNHYLAGISGYKIAEFDHMNKEIPIGLQTVSKPIPGEDVKLTIDSYIQYTLEKTLRNAAKEMEPKAIHAVVMEPSTGKIVAMASYPDFDPNTYEEFEPKDINVNAASYVFEPGSTFKPVFVAMGLEAGTIQPDTTFYDGGTINVNGTTLKNWDRTGFGTGGIDDIIVNSSNVGMVKIAQSMSNEQLVEQLKRAGYGKRLGIELPNEEVGLIPTVEQLKNDPLMKATIGFGQGISVTPLQMATAFSELINGGYRVKPTLIESVTNKNGDVKYEWKETQGEQIYSDETVRTLKEAMKKNAETTSGKEIMVDGYDGGGKTGSAWKVENGRYKDGAIIGSFIGFLPYDDPQYVMLAVVDEPTGIEFGSLSGGPVFNEAMTEITRYKNLEKTAVDPEDKKEEIKLDVKNYRMEYFEEAEAHLKEEFANKVTVEKRGDGKIVVNQDYYYNKGKLTVYLETTNMYENGTMTMPNLTGKTKEELALLMEDENMKIDTIGEGKVVFQSIEPGVSTTQNNRIKLWFE